MGADLPAPEVAVKERLEAGGLYKKWHKVVKPAVQKIVPLQKEVAPNGLGSGKQRADYMVQIRKLYYDMRCQGRQRG